MSGLEPEPEPELEQNLLLEAEERGGGGRGGMSAMEYPAGFSTLRRSGLAPGMDAYSAAGQLAVPLDQPLLEASDASPIGGGDLSRNSPAIAMEYPAGFSTLRRSGLAPGMNAYSAAGQLAVPLYQPPLAQASDASGDLSRNSPAQQMTGGIDKTSAPSLCVEVKEQVQASQQQSLQVTQSGAVGHEEQQLQRESFRVSESDDPHRLVEAKQKAFFRAVVQDNAAVVSNLIAQQPELLT